MKHKTQQIQTKNNLKRNPLTTCTQTPNKRILGLTKQTPQHNKINRNTHKTHQKQKRKLKIKKKKKKRQTKKLKKKKNKKTTRQNQKKKNRRFRRQNLLFFYQLKTIQNRLYKTKKKNLIWT